MHGSHHPEIPLRGILNTQFYVWLIVKFGNIYEKC